MFVAMSVIVFSYFYLNGKTFIHGDGWHQHYKALIYYHDYLRTIFTNIFINHKFEIPMWDFSLGEGQDIATAMHYYCIGDPFAFLVILCPKQYIYVFYCLIGVLKLYLAGIVFIALCLYSGKNNKYAILSGSLIYSFCYWGLLHVSKHIFFVNPLVNLPLVILGVEKILKDNKPLIFVLGVFVSAISSIYFFYMIVMLTVIYVLIRLLVTYKTDFKQIVIKIFTIGIHAVFPVLMAAIVFFPAAYALLTNNRVGTEYGLHLLYPRIYYERWTSILLTTDNTYNLVLCYASPVLLSIFLSYKQAKKKTLVFAINVVSLILITFPIFGKMLNGFAYVTNRWAFALALVTAYSFVDKWEDFEENRKLLLVWMIAFIPLCFFSAWQRSVKIVPLVICFVFLGVLFVNNEVKLNLKINKQIVLVSIVIFSLLYNADYAYSSRGRYRIRGAESVEHAKNVITETEAYKLKDYLNIEEFDRYSGSNITTNAAMLSGTHSTAYYFSVSNSYITNLRNALGINEYSIYWYFGYNQRAPLYTLANVKTYLTDKDSKELIPYGFEYENTMEGYDIYTNKYYIPFGYTYEKTISQESWNKLNQVEKQEVLLQNVVLENANDDKYDANCNSISYTLKAIDGLNVNGKTIDVYEKGASLIIELEKESKEELYLSVEKIKWENEDAYEDNITDANISVITSSAESFIEYHISDYQFYNGRDSFTVFLGSEPTREIKLEFDYEGQYSFEDLLITEVSREGYGTYTSNLSREHMENVVFDTNSVKGTINVSNNKYLVMSIPYAKGWKAYVDGKETEVLLANDCYSGLKLDAGYHEIELRYFSPVLKVATAVSVGSFAVYVVMMYLISKKKR